jgi:hypothetical protein
LYLAVRVKDHFPETEIAAVGKIRIQIKKLSRLCLLIQIHPTHWVSINQCCGSGIRCLFDPWIPDLGSRIPRPDFEELFDNFFGKNFYNSLKIGPNFVL